MKTLGYWTERAAVSRRGFLRGSAAVGAGLAGAALIGCGGGGSEAPKSAATSAAGGGATGGAKGPTVASVTGNNWTNREPDGVPKSGGTLNWSPGSPTLANLDPLTSTSAMVHQVAMPAYNALMQIGRDPKDRNSPWVFFPQLATKWETSDPTKMVFTLREGVKFHNVAPVNGRAFTSEDVKFALTRAWQDKGSLFKGAFKSLKSIETPDPKTVVLNLNGFDPLMMPQLGGHFAWITPKELVDANKIREQIIGTGPFVFQKWEQDARVSYKKNPDFYIKGAPFVDELNWLIIGNDDSRTAAFQSGQTNIYDVPENAIKDVKANKNYTVEDYLRVQPYVLFMKYNDDRFKDERVRKAVALALDTNVLLKTMQNGNGLWRGIVSNQHGGWTLSQDELKSKKYYLRQDLTEAKQLMAAAGKPDGIAGGLLYTTSYPQTYQDSVQYIAQTLTTNKIVNVKLDGKDLAAMRKSQDEQTYDALCLGLDGQGAPESFLLDYRSGGPKNGSGLKDKDVDADVDKVLAIIDVKERQTATKAFIDKYLQKVMYKVEFVDGMNYTAWSKEVKNFVDGPPFWYQSGHAFTWIDKG